MKISILAEHINKGHKRYAQFCPIAIACKPLFDHDLVITVGKEKLFVRKNKLLKAYNLPQHVKDFIKNFDLGNAVEPFNFEIDLNIPLEVYDETVKV